MPSPRQHTAEQMVICCHGDSIWGERVDTVINCLVFAFSVYVAQMEIGDAQNVIVVSILKHNIYLKIIDFHYYSTFRQYDEPEEIFRSPVTTLNSK